MACPAPLWLAILNTQYTITFNVNGGSEISPVTQAPGTTIDTEPIPTLENYGFDGWFLSPTFTDIRIVFPYTILVTETLYAKWSIDQHTITFIDAKGGTPAVPASITQDYGTTIDLPKSFLDGSEHVGWTLNIAGAGKVYTGLYTIENTETLYAKWTVDNRYTVSFDTDGGSPVAPQKKSLGNKVTLPVQPTKSNYTFVGWYKDSVGTILWDFNVDTITSSTTIYAKWSIDQHTITFNANGGSSVAPSSITQDYGTTIVNLPTSFLDGYTLVGWCENMNGSGTVYVSPYTVKKTTTLYAKWNDNIYTVSFDTIGGSPVAPQKKSLGNKVTLPVQPTKSNYTFGGWCKDRVGTNPWNFNVDTITSSTTIYAKWSIDQHTITFNANGGSATAPVTQDYGTTIDDKPISSHEGNIFEGWYEAANFTGPETVFPYTIKKTITLYAKWRVRINTVSFNTDGGTAVAQQKIRHGDKVNLPVQPTKSNYTFVGWYKDSVGTNPWNFAVNTIIGDTTIYAKWLRDAVSTDFGLLEINIGGVKATIKGLEATVNLSVGLPHYDIVTIATVNAVCTLYSDKDCTVIFIPAVNSVKPGNRSVFYVRVASQANIGDVKIYKITVVINGETSVKPPATGDREAFVEPPITSGSRAAKPPTSSGSRAAKPPTTSGSGVAKWPIISGSEAVKSPEVEEPKDIENLPQKEDPLKSPEKAFKKVEESTDSIDIIEKKEEVQKNEPKSGFGSALIFIIILILGIGGVGFYYMIYKPKKKLKK